MSSLRLASQSVPDELLDHPRVVLPVKRSGRKASPLTIDFIRELEQADVDALLAPPVVKPMALAPVVRELKESHHRLAMLMATERSQVQVSLLSGYSEAYIGRLTNDPMFRSLMDQYGKLEEVKFRDTLEKMDSVGRDALNELQLRLAEAPESFSNRELVETVDSMISKPKAAIGAGGGIPNATAAPTINISFRTPKIQPDVIEVEVIK